MKKHHVSRTWIIRLAFVLSIVLFTTANAPQPAPSRQVGNPSPPSQVVKLIFIHHSTGENWLADDYGGLGLALSQNNYFVSDTNYGWGPDAIGDRTHIPDWLAWFRSENTDDYMEAVYNESGQNSAYTRTVQDPGGENQIIMFKSCFPNSELEGSPNDPPDPEGWISVGHAKYVYNEILQYFSTRPDKLFIVITAPPVQNPEYAENARAFNNWLVYDWLSENNYPYANVAVFDFYNVLTGPNNHHRLLDGEIQHIYTEGMNTAYYPTEDDHPSVRGSRKATEEFVDLLNIYYRRWIENAPSQPAPGGHEPTTGGTTNAPSDSESETPSFQTYWDETTATRITCDLTDEVAYVGTSSLQIDFDVVAGSWSTCVISLASMQEWTDQEGIAFRLRAQRAGMPYNVIVYSGSMDEQESYLVYFETPEESVGDWAYIEIPWGDFARAEWEANGGTPFEITNPLLSIAFGFDGLETANNTGTIWVDDIRPFGAGIPAEESAEDGGTGGIPCLSAILLPLVLTGLALVLRIRR